MHCLGLGFYGGNPVSTGGGALLFRDICQMGSLAEAAYLLHDNAGVLRRAQWEQKSHVEHKRKACLINDFQYESRLRKQGQRSFAKNRKYEQIIPEVSE
ncbi:hypothetical protein LSM04_009435 [Trypanosoma melophagium]|nr:hypothetical protein LSM04_009435 [Trypanosoma melophagium]